MQLLNWGTTGLQKLSYKMLSLYIFRSKECLYKFSKIKIKILRQNGAVQESWGYKLSELREAQTGNL